MNRTNWTCPPFVIVSARHIANRHGRRDPTGLAERLKGILDGIVDSGALIDDDDRHIEVRLLPYEKRAKPHPPGIQITITPVGVVT